MFFGGKVLLQNPANTRICLRFEGIFFLSLAVLTVTAVISGLVNEYDFKRLDRLSLSVFSILIYFFYRNEPTNEGALWLGLFCGAVVAGMVAIYQVLIADDFLGTWGNRAGGVINPIMFGNISLVMGFMLLAGSGWFIKQYRRGIIFPLLGMLFGLVASALSLSRGGWIALPVVILVFVWFAAKHIAFTRILSVLALVLLTIGIIYNTPQSKLKDRIEITLDNYNRYIASDSVDDPVRNTSLGLRLDMWKTVWYIFQENPLLGVGWGSFSSQAEKYIAQKLVSENVARFPHPHNQYLSALAKGGLLGFLAVLLIFVLPMHLFYKAAKSDASSAKTKRIALAGLVFLLSFMIFAFTEAVFERSRIMTFFAFYLVVLMALMKSSIKQTGQ